MKTKLSVLALAVCGLLAFTGCDDDDNNYVPEQTITKAFDEKYPNAGRVEWETKTGYQVADFKLNGNDTEAWFDASGKWLLTKTEIPFGQLPELVRTNLKAPENIYNNWKIEDTDKLERPDAATIYIIEVEQGENEAELYYTEDGILFKIVTDKDNINNNDDFQPNPQADEIKKRVIELYPNAVILEYDVEKTGIEIDILHNNIHKEVILSSTYEWIMTEWDIRTTDLPAIVTAALNGSAYKDYRIEDVNQIERPDGTFYKLELEQRDNEVDMIIGADGTIISTTPDR